MEKAKRIIVSFALILAMIIVPTGAAFAEDIPDAVTGEVLTETTEAEITDDADVLTNDGSDQEVTEPAESIEPTEPQDPEVTEPEVQPEEIAEPAETEEAAVPEVSSEVRASVKKALPAANAAAPEAANTTVETRDVSGNPDEEEEQQLIDISKYTLQLSRSHMLYTGQRRQCGVKAVKDSKGRVLDPRNYKVTYSYNLYAGTAKVTVTGVEKNGYTGTVSGTFYIVGTVKNLVTVKRMKTAVILGWDKYTKVPVDGYKVYLYNKETKEYKLIKLIKGIDNTQYKVTGLKPSNAYRFVVSAYVKDKVNGMLITGPKSAAKYLYTLPATPPKATITLIKAKKPYVRLEWKNLGTKAVRYQIEYSRYSTFKNSKTVTINNKDASHRNLYGLKNGVKYYFRVRAVNEYQKRNAYGTWSDVRTVYPTSTGWATFSGKKFYYINGYKAKGSYTIGGEPYYFDEETGECHGASYNVWKLAKNASSGTKYLIGLSVNKHRVNVFEKKDGEWVMKYQWRCTTGVNPNHSREGNFTPRGVYKIGKKLRYFGDTYTVWWASNFTGAVWFHSVLYNPGSTTEIQDGRLGIAASHGCVRLAIENSKWIYDNADAGTRVISAD